MVDMDLSVQGNMPHAGWNLLMITVATHEIKVNYVGRFLISLKVFRMSAC